MRLEFRSLRFVIAAICAIAVMCLHASTAIAEPASAANSDQYRAYVDSALREYKLGNFNEAKSFFAQAHALSPSARTMRGLGTCSFELRNYVDAIQWFEQALSSTNRPLTADMREEIQALLRQARAFITRVRISVEPSWAKLRVDTRPTERDATGFLRIDPGTHELAVEAPHYETAMRTIRTAGGEELELEITLSPRREPRAPPETRAPEPQLTAAPASAAAPAPAAESAHGSSAGPWVVMAASAGVAIAGGVFLALALHDKSSVESPEGFRPRYDRAADDRVLPFSIIGISGLSLGTAGLIGGIVWKLSDSSSGDDAPLALDVSPTGLRVRGSF
jgi:PEGA domain